MPLGQSQKREVAAAQRCLRVGDDSAQTGDAPARADERSRRGMLPALQLRHAKRDDVGIEERTAALQRGEQAAIDFRERSEEHTSELQSRLHLVCRLLLEKKKRSIGVAGRI